MLAVMFALGLAATMAVGDEVVIGENSKSTVLGDFDCSTCPMPTSSFQMLAGGDSGEFTAGELWKYFDSQGVDQLHSLTLCLDLEPNDDTSEFGLESIQLRIQDPSDNTILLTDVSMGDNSLIVPSYDISSLKPEAKLQIALGYDFMSRFSADSTEKISLDVATNGEASSNPIFSVEGGSGFFLKRYNIFALAVFAGFWVVVFIALNRFTKPQIALAEPQAPTSSSIKRRALSA
jgi:hypothetical protein